MAHKATVLEPGDEMFVGFLYPNGKYVEVKLMAGEDVLQVESRDESIQVVGGHRCMEPYRTWSGETEGPPGER